MLEKLRLKLGIRSSGWKLARKLHIDEFCYCAACNAVKSLVVHHIVPYHVDRSLELDPSNLITLCRKCHLTIGHINDYRLHNSCVRVMSSQLLMEKTKRILGD